jgi:LysM repeat protein
VQPKDGLYSISKKYGVSVQQLKEWNNLTTDTLSIGQKLIVAK